jgi:hypothetical protein
MEACGMSIISRAFRNPEGKLRWKRVLGWGTVAVFLIQYVLGRAVFEYECRVNEGFWWSGKVVHADSYALDGRKEDYATENKGCGDCAFSLTADDNRMEFVEVLVTRPNPDYLSTEPGWYRYGLASAGDPECAAYAQSKTAQQHLASALFDSRQRRFRVPPASLCIASRKIDAPESRYLKVDRHGSWKRPAFGVSTSIYEFKDRISGELLYRSQWTRYFGPWPQEVLVSLDHFLGGASAGVSCKREKVTTSSSLDSSKPISGLKPLTESSVLKEK